MWQTSDEDGLHLNGTTAGGGILIRAGTELRSIFGHPWRIDKVDPASNAAAVSPDGRTLAIVIAGSLDKEGQSHDAKLFLVDTATGRSRVQVGDYEGPVWSPGGTRIAAVAKSGLAIIDSATRKEVTRVAWPKPDRFAEDLVWSPDGKSILAGLNGESAGSGDPQRDYFLSGSCRRDLDAHADGSEGGLASGRRHPLVSAAGRDDCAGTGKGAQRLDRATCGFRPYDTQGS